MIVISHTKAPDSVPVYGLDLCLARLTLLMVSVPGFTAVINEKLLNIIDNASDPNHIFL